MSLVSFMPILFPPATVNSHNNYNEEHYSDNDANDIPYGVRCYFLYGA